jgi:hypothetical protein
MPRSWLIDPQQGQVWALDRPKPTIHAPTPLFVQLDPSDVIAEVSEDNNIGWAQLTSNCTPVTVPEPSLALCTAMALATLAGLRGIRKQAANTGVPAASKAFDFIQVLGSAESWHTSGCHRMPLLSSTLNFPDAGP